MAADPHREPIVQEPFFLTGTSPDRDLEKRLEGMQEFARQYTYNQLARERSDTRVTASARKLSAYLDSEIEKTHTEREAAGGKNVDCRAGCCHCCYQPISATIAEVLSIGEFVRSNFTPEQITAFRERIDGYIAAMLPLRKPDVRRARVACPALVDGLCSIYPARPLGCRGLNSIDVRACEQIKLQPDAKLCRPSLEAQALAADRISLGLRLSTHAMGLDREPVELGLALKTVLDDPQAGIKYAEDADPFASDKMAQGADPVEAMAYANAGHAFRYSAKREAIGDVHPAAVDSLTKAIPLLANAHQLPMAYESTEQILQARQRYVENLRSFARSNFNPAQIFDALSLYDTFPLAYQNMNDRDIMREQGDLLVHGVTGRVFPDLIQPVEKRKRSGKYKVGYISASMFFHNGSRWAHGWLKNHAEDIETYSFNVSNKEDNASRMFRDASDYYFHMTGPIAEAARFIKSLELDMLIFTDIGMTGRNFQFASMRIAHTQCTAWGHPVTSGLPTIDYYLSSELMEPPDGQEHYTEKLVRLPGTGLCYPRITSSEQPTGTREDLGLPSTGPIYLMAQNLMKCTPEYDFLFRRINERTGAPIVFIKMKEEGINAITKKRLEAAGVQAIWLDPLPRHKFLWLMQACDVSIDPPAWSGGNTTIEALFYGKPVVALPGKFMRGRHSLAFLQVANAPGLIAKDADDYVDLVADHGRRQEAMKNLDADALFEDTKCVAAIDSLVRESAT